MLSLESAALGASVTSFSFLGSPPPFSWGIRAACSLLWPLECGSLQHVLKIQEAFPLQSQSPEPTDPDIACERPWGLSLELKNSSDQKGTLHV